MTKLSISFLVVFLADTLAFRNNFKYSDSTALINRISKLSVKTPILKDPQSKYGLHSKIILNKLNAVVSLPIPDLIRNPKSSTFSNLLSSIRGVFLISVGFFASLKSKFQSNIKIVASNAMESGWTKRGYSGSFSRTLEIWGFAISFLYKFVRINYLYYIIFKTTVESKEA